MKRPTRAEAAAVVGTGARQDEPFEAERPDDPPTEAEGVTAADSQTAAEGEAELIEPSEVSDPIPSSEAAAAGPEPDENAEPNSSSVAEPGTDDPAANDLLPDGPGLDMPESGNTDRV